MGSSLRIALPDGSFVDWSLVQVAVDKWRPHGIKYRIAWIQNKKCRVLFDNHHGKHDHLPVDGVEKHYVFRSVEVLW